MRKNRLDTRKKHPLLRHAKWIAMCGIIGGGIAFTNTYLAKPVYRTKVQLLVSTPVESVVLGISFLSGNTATPVTIITGLFESPALVSTLSREAKMDERDLARSWFVQNDPLTSQIELTLDHQDPQRAATIIRRALEIGRILEVDSVKSTSKSKAEQLKQSYEARLKAVDQAEIAYRDFLQKSLPETGSILGSDRQTWEIQQLRSRIQADESKISAMRANARRAISNPAIPKQGPVDVLRQRLNTLQAELDSIRSQLGPDAPELKSKQDEVQSVQKVYDRELAETMQALEADLNSEIGAAQAALDAKRWQLNQIVLSSGGSPKVASEMQTLIRQLRSAYRAAAETRAEYEAARADSSIERSNWQRISSPFVLEKPINKGLIRTSAAGFALGAFLAAFFAMLLTPKSEFKEVRLTPKPEEDEESWTNAA
jgi:uncharacterized protein involved in exopolysaccharide biosynthesis